MVETIFQQIHVNVSMKKRLKHVNAFFRDKRSFFVNNVCLLSGPELLLMPVENSKVGGRMAS